MSKVQQRWEENKNIIRQKKKYEMTKGKKNYFEKIKLGEQQELSRNKVKKGKE